MSYNRNPPRSGRHRDCHSWSIGWRSKRDSERNMRTTSLCPSTSNHSHWFYHSHRSREAAPYGTRTRHWDFCTHENQSARSRSRHQ